ncbi:MAG: hypothetical protein QFX34_01485, partial [Candidatus Verstraetearchaeota archaeon]|nr:hypothetical protein [Candidatus Verstraetearchaeota archaeon]
MTEDFFNKLEKFEQFGNIYVERYLDNNELKDWVEALEFFFNHSFYKGRNDLLSSEYCTHANEFLKEKKDEIKRLSERELIEAIFEL